MKFHFLFYDHNLDCWLEFKKPLHIFTADSQSEIISTLEKIELLTQQSGFYATGFISYEAATAFDDSLKVKCSLPSEFPLIQFAIFDKPEIVNIKKEHEQAFCAQCYSEISKDEYLKSIGRIKELIADGDTYQVNLTYRNRVNLPVDPLTFFFSITGNDPPPYSCYLQTPYWTICSFSPELFFELDNHVIRCKPMKGTHCRGRDSLEDELFSETLYNSEKNRAENIMIVDMIRNDLGRIAKSGTIKVDKLFAIEKYPTVFQMTSSISAVTDESVVNIFKALFPCASITGAPKKRTMEIISMIEKSPRHLYTGAIGYLAPNRKAVFNVAIRTVLINNRAKSAEYGTGGGVVWDSEANDEFDESISKTSVLFSSSKSFSLFETILWTPENGYFLFDYHLKRLELSSRYFCFKTDMKEVYNRLINEAQSFNSDLSYKVKLEVDRDGFVWCKSAPLDLSYRKSPIRIVLASEPVYSGNVLLYHKTNNRDIYNNAQNKNFDDVLLWNERKEITETTIANVVFEIDGKMITPKLYSGLLPGVFRAFLLDTNAIEEAVVGIDDIKRAKRIFRINSVRKWEECIFEKK